MISALFTEQATVKRLRKKKAYICVYICDVQADSQFTDDHLWRILNVYTESICSFFSAVNHLQLFLLF